jgi:hypothetical protein
MSGIYSSRRWKAVRAFVLLRDAGVCRWCGAEATDADHVVPLAEGGAPFDARNVAASCEACNSRRGGMQRSSSRPGSSLAPGSGFLRADSSSRDTSRPISPLPASTRRRL